MEVKMQSKLTVKQQTQHQTKACTALTDIEDLPRLLEKCNHDCNVTVNSTTIKIPAEVLRKALASNQSASQHMK
jgi:hypothetical protein